MQESEEGLTGFELDVVSVGATVVVVVIDAKKRLLWRGTFLVFRRANGFALD